LSASKIEQLENVLPPKPKVNLTGEEEECSVKAVDIKQFGTSDNGEASRQHDSDDEYAGRGGGQQGVQCAQG